MHSAIHEVRALLVQFERSPLRDLYWRGRDWSVFMARDGGAANPMLAETELPAPDAPLTPDQVTAPHLGMFDPRCIVGDLVERNALIGVIDVLGRQTEVFSAHAGQVTAVRFAANALVEYGDNLVNIAPAA